MKIIQISVQNIASLSDANLRSLESKLSKDTAPTRLRYCITIYGVTEETSLEDFRSYNKHYSTLKRPFTLQVYRMSMSAYLTEITVNELIILFKKLKCL
jgi:hypothetical protein